MSKNKQNNLHKETNSSKNTILNSNGYLIKKNDLNQNELKTLKKNLTVTPKTLEVGQEVVSFPVYSDNNDFISIPRFYGIQNYGIPKKDELVENKINIDFKGNLREYQTNLVNMCIDSLKNKGGGLLCVGCGQGKCLAKGTLVLMFDGSLKLVENINIGDLIMGDDSTPRKILSIAHGSELMYDIIDNYTSTKYTVNSSHILSLKWTSDTPILINNKKYFYNDTVDIEVSQFINLDMSIKQFLLGYRVPVNFKCNSDNSYNYYYDKGYSLDLYNKDISLPNDFKISSFNNRFALLSGLIDRAGFKITLNSLSNNQIESINNLQFSVTMMSEKLANDLIFVARSVGLISHYKKYHNNKYFTVTFEGSQLNKLNIKCHKFNTNDICNINDELYYSIQVKPTSVDFYYGFEIDGNRRFILGDLTVTHNTVMALNVIAKMNVKTLVLVHKTFLQEQWVERCSQFTNAKIGIIRQNKVEVEGFDICIGMVQSITSRDYDPKLFEQFSLVVFDEAHRYPSRIFSQAFQKTCPKYILSLTATPNRTDGLTKVLYWFSGDIIYKQLSKPNKQVIVKVFNYESTDKLFVEKTMWIKGKTTPSNTKMVNNLVQIKSRNQHILNILNRLRKNPERKVLVLSGRREHLKDLKDSLDASIQKDIDDGNIMKDECRSYYYVGGMKKWDLQEAAQKGDILFGTYDMAQEGLDIDKLNTLVLATPKKNVTQALGRVMRKILKEGDVRPLIIDVCDNLSIYSKQGALRQKLYNKNKYRVEHYYLHNDQIKDYNYFLKNTMELNDDELLQFKDDPAQYIPDLNSILDLQKVEDEDLNINNNENQNENEDNDEEIEDDIYESDDD